MKVIPRQSEWPWPVFAVQVPGVPDLYMVRDKGIAFALTPDQWRPAGQCDCLVCRGQQAHWDTLRVHPACDHPWRVHWPELQPQPTSITYKGGQP